MIKMVRAAQPALDRVMRTLKDDDRQDVADNLTVQFRQMSVRITARPDDFDYVTPVILNEFRVDGWGFHTEYKDNDSRTGERVAFTMDHPISLTRTGDEVKNRPALMGLEIPLPDRRVRLDAQIISGLVNEAAETVRDLLTQLFVTENGPEVNPVRPVPLWAAPLAVLDDDEGDQ